MLAALRRLGDLALLYQLAVLGAALEHLERGLFLDGFGHIARVVALGAGALDEAGALHAAGEFADKGKGIFRAALLYFCIYHRS